MLAVLLLAGCTIPTDPPPAPSAPAPETTAPSAPVSPSASPSAPGATGGEWTYSDEAKATLATIEQSCAPGEGKKITELDDPQISGVQYTGVPELNVPDVNLPDTTGEAGCIVEYAAPAGCLGAVEITNAVLPGLTIPGFTINDRNGVQRQGRELLREAMIVEGRKLEPKCQVTKAGSRVTAGVVRAGMIRAGAVQAGMVRAGMVNPGGGTVPALTVPAATIPAATQPAKTLPARVSDTTTTLDGDNEKAYSAKADVFFDYDKSNLKPAARKILDAIVKDIAKVSPNGAVRVEGHTDSDGSTSYNQSLSERRAKAVADYLRSKGIAASRITSRGYGETVPAAPNTSKSNKAENRRVVIAVAKG